jgi:transposase
MGRQRRKKQERRAAQREVHLAELAGIVERAKSALGEDDYATLKSAIETLAFLTQEIAAKRTSIDRLRKMLFGTSSAKTSHVTGSEPKKETASKPGDGDGEKPKRPGHGRNGAAAYTGAQKVKVTHLVLGHGDACPECEKGKVYPMAEPQVLLRVRGMAPIVATVYECDRLRCNLCGEIFTASAPPGVGDEKYDATAAAMVALLKYGAGLPFYRIEKLQAGFGIPLPSATQWEIVARTAKLLEPAHDELLNQAAQADLVHNDDTAAKILELGSAPPGDAPADDGDDERTGIFTSAIVAEGEQHRIALFFTGQKHAGENLAGVLARRRAELAAPIQMCDALSRNLPGELKTIIANCICHARRKFVDVVNDFPDEVRHLLETLREVYKIDAQAREQGLSPDERLRLHQIESAPLMEALEKWLRALIDERKVEPNSGLGEAIGYMLKHWTKLTLFLRVPGAPLDNNICERALKKAILHRKNALFYKTQNGAHVGDVFMSLIHSAELNRVGAFDYLVALQRHHEDVAAEPGEWMPWNYHAALARLAESAPPS